MNEQWINVGGGRAKTLEEAQKIAYAGLAKDWPQLKGHTREVHEVIHAEYSDDMQGVTLQALIYDTKVGDEYVTRYRKLK